MPKSLTPCPSCLLLCNVPVLSSFLVQTDSVQGFVKTTTRLSRQTLNCYAFFSATIIGELHIFKPGLVCRVHWTAALCVHRCHHVNPVSLLEFYKVKCNLINTHLGPMKDVLALLAHFQLRIWTDFWMTLYIDYIFAFVFLSKKISLNTFSLRSTLHSLLGNVDTLCYPMRLQKLWHLLTDVVWLEFVL